MPLRDGQLAMDDLQVNLGEIVAGLKPGRSDEQQITIFDSTGLAIQDVALARSSIKPPRSRVSGSPSTSSHDCRTPATAWAKRSPTA